MPENGGKRKGAGRPKGAMSKTTMAVKTMLDSIGCNPIDGMARIAIGDVDCALCKGAKVMPDQMDEDGNNIPCELCHGSGKEYVPTKMRFDAMKEVAQYVAPKLTAQKVEIHDTRETQAQWLTRIAHESEEKEGPNAVN